MVFRKDWHWSVRFRALSSNNLDSIGTRASWRGERQLTDAQGLAAIVTYSYKSARILRPELSHVTTSLRCLEKIG
jgi:hypothetical protein